MLPHLRAKVQKDTLLALHVCELATLCHSLGNPFIIENPAPRDDAPPIFELDEYLVLRSLPGVCMITFSQCHFDSYSRKPTALLYFGVNPDPRVFKFECDHPSGPGSMRMVKHSGPDIRHWWENVLQF